MVDEIRWPQDAAPLTTQQVLNSTPIMAANQSDLDKMSYVTVGQLADKTKEIVEITGELIDPIAPGTQASPAVIPAGPAGQKRKFEPAPGYYSYGGQTYNVTSDKRWYLYWNGTTWQLVDLGLLPNDVNKQVPYSLGTAKSAPQSISSRTFIFRTPVPYTGRLDTIELFSNAGSQMIVKIFRRSTADNLLYIISEKQVNPSVGNNTIKLDLPVAKDDFVGIYNQNAILYETATAWSTYWFSAAGVDLQNGVNTGALSAENNTNILVKLNFIESPVLKYSDIIDNLSLGGRSSVLSAEQGKIIGQNLYKAIKVNPLNFVEFTQVSFNDNTLANGDPIPFDGKIENLYVRTINAGNLTIRVFRPNTPSDPNTTYRFLFDRVYAIAAAGENTLPFGANLLKGDIIGFVQGNNRSNITFRQSATGAKGFSFGTSATTGDNLTAVRATGSRYALYYDIVSNPFQVSEIPNDGLAEIAKLPLSGEIDEVNFKNVTSIPTNWKASAGWSINASGLGCSNTGYGAFAYWNRLIVIDSDASYARVVFNTVNDILSLARISANGAGTSMEVNVSLGRFRVGRLDAEGATPTYDPNTITPLDFNIVIGREYIIAMQKKSKISYFSVSDTITQETTTLVWDRNHMANHQSTGQMWNGAGVINVAGSARVLSHYYGSKLPKSPRILFVGDSITNGEDLLGLPNGGVNARWANRMANAMGVLPDTTMFARGGDFTQNVRNKLPLMLSFIDKPQIVMYALGTNGNSFDIWLNDTLYIKEQFEKIGCEFIICIPVSRPTNIPYINEIADWVRKSGNRYVDFLKATTVDGNGIDHKDFFLEDDIHPNVDGHEAMFEQIKIDLPDLF